MIILPEDVRISISMRMLDLYSSSESLPDFLIKARDEFPDDPTLSYGYWIGLAVGRIEGKTKAANDLMNLAKKYWGGNEIIQRPLP